MMKTQALIFANGETLDGLMVQRALAEASDPLIVAADGGARVAQYFGFTVDVLIGDMDSISPQEHQTLIDSGAVIVEHPPEKDFTDLELALYHISEKGIQWVRIIGGTGGRIDQTIANIYLLGLPALTDGDVRLVAEAQEIRLLYPGEHLIEGAAGDTISLIPLGGAVHGIHTENLHYPLNDETLEFGPARGISNVMNGDLAKVTTRDGTLLLVHTVGRA